MLCLGVGVNVVHFNRTATTLSGQLFGSQEQHHIKRKIGHLKMISSIETTFDLLSSDAFSKYNIRHTVFNDCTFTHFIPLFINEQHGKKSMKLMNKFVLKLWNKSSNHCVIQECHPWLKLYTIANMMKSLIVSVMKSCENKNGVISLHYSTNVLETFFRLHHTLLGVYLQHKCEISKLLQYQIEKFFDKDKKHIYRNKECIPDFGVFLCYLTLWEHKKKNRKTNNNNNNNKKYKWFDIVYELLDEIFVRQSKWVLKAHDGLKDPKYCSFNERILFHWKTNQVSNRLFMFNCFFFRTCCKIGNSGKKNNLSLKKQLSSYNNNFGFPSDDTLAYKFQQYVKKVHLNVCNFEDMFEMIGIEYPGNKELGLWFIDCMNESEHRGYHKSYHYGSNNYKTASARDQERKDWIKQQQLEREQLAQEKLQQLEKQQQLKQRRLQQAKEARIREERGKTRSEYSLPVEGTFSFSKITGGIIISNNVETQKIKKRSCDYVRVYVRLIQSSSEVASLDEMIIDAFNRHPNLNGSKTGLCDGAKTLYSALFNGFANNEDGTMSRDDLRNYLIYYDVGEENVSVDDKVDRIFDAYDNDESKNKLCKNEFLDFLFVAPHDQINRTAQYPDRFRDGVTIPIKKEENRKDDVDVVEPRYYSDFHTKNVCRRLGSMRNIRMRVRGKYIDGTTFEFVQLSEEQEKCKHEHLAKQVQKWWKTESEEKESKSQIKDELRSMVEFSISTIKNGVISDNVNEIALDCDIVRVFVAIVVNKNYKRQIKGFSGMYFDGKTCKTRNAGLLSFPDYHHDCKLNVVVHGPINEQNGSNNLIFYSDFSLKTLCNRFGNELKNGISPRVTGLKMNGNVFFICGGCDCIFYGKRVAVARQRDIVTPARRRSRRRKRGQQQEEKQQQKQQEKQQEQQQEKQQQLDRPSWRSQRQRAQQPKQQAQQEQRASWRSQQQRQKQSRQGQQAPPQPKQQQPQPQQQPQHSHHSQRPSPQPRHVHPRPPPGAQPPRQPKRSQFELEEQLKQWLKIERDWIHHNVSNKHTSPYSNGERKTIESQIYSGLECPRVKFNISTIKNGVISDNVNEISLDCQIVRVVIIVSKLMNHGGLNRQQIDFFDELCFDGESTCTMIDQNCMISYPDRVLDRQKDIGINIHGPFEDKNNQNNTTCYGDFLLSSLCNRFGKDLLNGITPRVSGYTMNGNKFYCCGGYDYLICGRTKTKTINNQWENDIYCDPSCPSSMSSDHDVYDDDQRMTGHVASGGVVCARQAESHEANSHPIRQPAPAPIPQPWPRPRRRRRRRKRAQQQQEQQEHEHEEKRECKENDKEKEKETNTIDKYVQNKECEHKERECKAIKEHIYGMSFGKRKQKKEKKSSDFKSGGWLKISREADNDTSSLYDSIFNKENEKLLQNNNTPINQHSINCKSEKKKNDNVRSRTESTACTPSVPAAKLVHRTHVVQYYPRQLQWVNIPVSNTELQLCLSNGLVRKVNPIAMTEIPMHNPKCVIDLATGETVGNTNDNDNDRNENQRKRINLNQTQTSWNDAIRNVDKTFSRQVGNKRVLTENGTQNENKNEQLQHSNFNNDGDNDNDNDEDDKKSCVTSMIVSTTNDNKSDIKSISNDSSKKRHHRARKKRKNKNKHKNPNGKK